MLSPQALLKLIVSRVLPQVRPDGTESETFGRGGRYGEAYMLSMVRKAHMLADEGSYFVTNNAQTGILSAAALTPAATTPSLIISNTDQQPNGKRIYLDYIDLLCTAAGVTATASGYKALAIVLDSILRYTSGGTVLTANIVNPNMDSLNKSVASVVFGSITAAAASVAARTVVGLRQMRLPVTATTAPDIANERFRLEFGNVESSPNSSSSASAAGLDTLNTDQVIKLPPIVIGPQQSFLLYLFQQGATTYSTATTYAPEIGWWER